MAASIGVRLFCVFRRPDHLCLLKSKLVNAAQTRLIQVFQKYTPGMQINVDVHQCCDILHHLKLNQSGRGFMSMPTGKYLHSCEALPERICWKCGRSIDPYLELFFCKCGVVQTPADINFFKLMGLKESFDVDVANLSHMLIDLQKRLHPDKYQNKSDTEKELAEKQSSLINKAYTTLSKPLPRAIYLLDLHNHSITEEEEVRNLEFLNEIMELNEALAEATQVEEVDSLEKKVLEQLELTLKKMSEAFRRHDYKSAKPNVVKYQYYINVRDKIKQYYRQLMI
ncbi:iron-sulfur cluster co-chaperone protein HscB-like [Gigantopelta aegis]|uniref:iron-sulfur cluster co-chaperone protein HscB-like n=1 Tax=Gigantopelta aegis TaxID=1735272 RepID=UPI001B88BF42|nr:iron-sulfur cluster co-chaperone protein HscB-like [Gigantopelta aegis]